MLMHMVHPHSFFKKYVHIFIYNITCVILTILSYDLVVLLTFIMLYKHHYYLFLKLFRHPKQDLCTH